MQNWYYFNLKQIFKAEVIIMQKIVIFEKKILTAVYSLRFLTFSSRIYASCGTENSFVHNNF